MINNVQFYEGSVEIPRDEMDQEFHGHGSTLVWNRPIGGAVIPIEIGTQKFGHILVDDGFSFKEVFSPIPSKKSLKKDS